MLGLKKQPPRRSELRLGKRTINYQTETFQPRLSLTPVLAYLRVRQVKLVGGGLLLFLGWLLYSLFTTSTFFVYTATIQGNAAISANEIYVTSQIDSKSIFWLDASQIAANIMSLPNIKSAEVSLQLPAQVTIVVTERQPELLWQTGEAVWWVDGEGIIVPPRGDTSGMLRIVDNDRQPVEVGYQVDPTIIKGAQMLQLLAPGLSEIQHSRSLGLTVATPEGWPVYLGDGSEMRQKLTSLTAVLTYVKDQEVEPVYIDVRDPLRPVYKEKEIITITPPPPNFVPRPFIPQPLPGRPRF